MFCVAAAMALMEQPGVDAEAVVRRAMKIAGDICVYTNHNILLERLEPKAMESTESAATTAAADSPSNTISQPPTAE